MPICEVSPGNNVISDIVFGCNLIPFLYFGAELMRSLGHYSLIFPARRTALMRGALGENSLSPHWITTAHQEENQLPYGKYGMD